MTKREQFVLKVYEHATLKERLDEYVQQRWPHDVYLQTVAVMGHDPLGEMRPHDEQEPPPTLADSD